MLNWGPDSITSAVLVIVIIQFPFCPCLSLVLTVLCVNGKIDDVYVVRSWRCSIEDLIQSPQRDLVIVVIHVISLLPLHTTTPTVLCVNVKNHKPVPFFSLFIDYYPLSFTSEMLFRGPDSITSAVLGHCCSAIPVISFLPLHTTVLTVLCVNVKDWWCLLCNVAAM